MTAEALKGEQSEAKETREISFRCKFCGKTKPLGEIRTLTRFFPPIVVCRDCEKKMR